MVYLTCSNLQPHNSVLPERKVHPLKTNEIVVAMSTQPFVASDEDKISLRSYRNSYAFVSELSNERNYFSVPHD